jgi:type II secretory pathway pseudopilin PulG
MTILETLVAAVVLVIGIAGGLVGFVGAQHLTFTAQRESQAARIAEADLESIVGRPYANIAVTALPSHVSDSDADNPSDPRYYVNDPSVYTHGCSGSTFAVLEDPHDATGGQIAEAPACGEQLVSSSAGGVSQSVPTSSGEPSGTIYRFVTWRNESCNATSLGAHERNLLQTIGDVVSGLVTLLFGSGNANPPATPFCSTPNNEKRVTVAVVLTQPTAGVGLVKPVYLSTIVPDPAAGAPVTSGCNGLLALFCG